MRPCSPTPSLWARGHLKHARARMGHKGQYLSAWGLHIGLGKGCVWLHVFMSLAHCRAPVMAFWQLPAAHWLVSFKVWL